MIWHPINNANGSINTCFVSRVRLIWARQLGTTKSLSWESFLSCKRTTSSSICPRTSSAPNEGWSSFSNSMDTCQQSPDGLSSPHRRCWSIQQVHIFTMDKVCTAPIHPQLLHTDAYEKAFVPTAAAIPWQD